MVDPEGPDLGDAGLVFAAQNNHDPRCGPPPRLRNTADPGLYHGYFENRFGEQFVFTFDRATGAGTVWDGDLGWGEPQPFTLGLLAEASGLPVIDAALVLGRVTGLMGKDELIWLRACLAACTPILGPREGHQS